jgi:hypothetical protein
MMILIFGVLAVVGAVESYDKPDPVTEAKIEETASKEEQHEIRRDAREDVLGTGQR